MNTNHRRLIAAGLVALALVIHLAGCQTMRAHPYLTGFVATSLVISAGTHHSSDSDRHIPTPSVDCSNGGCR